MSYQNSNSPLYVPEDTDDTCTESTLELIRHSSEYYFNIVLDIIQVHTKQNIE